VLNPRCHENQLPSKLYALVERTVVLNGLTVPEFVVAALNEEALALITASGPIRLTSADQIAFAQSANPSRSADAALWSYQSSEIESA